MTVFFDRVTPVSRSSPQIARRRRRQVRLACEPLEQRALLSVTGSAMVHQSASVDDQAYVSALIGNNATVTPAEARLQETLLSELARGVPRRIVAFHLLRSEPSREVQANSTYLRMLGRVPSEAELARAVKILGKRDSRPLVTRIAATGEFYRFQGGGTDEGFINAVYQEALHRDPTAEETAAGLNLLEQGGSRRRLAATLVQGGEGKTTRVLDIMKSYGASTDAAMVESNVAALRNRRGLYRVAARSLANDSVYQRIVRPSPSRAGVSRLGSANNHPPGLPVAPGFDLVSNLRAVALNDATIYGTNAISSGSDDILWAGGSYGLITYDPSTGLPTSQNGPSYVASVSAINAREAYAVGGAGKESPVSIVHILNGVVSPLPGLPAGDMPQMVSASTTDGTLWALGQSGAIYAYESGAWTAVPLGGQAIASISVGSATNIVALSTSGAALQYTTAGGFQVIDGYSNGVQGLQATSDGSIWLTGSGFVFLKQPGSSKFALVPKQPPVLEAGYLFAAGTRNRAYTMGLLPGSIITSATLVSVGLINRDPVPYPSYTGEAQAAYLALSVIAGVTDSAGVRAFYNQPGSTFSDFYTNIDNARTPPPNSPIPGEVWTAVREELKLELSAVQTVYGRMNVLASLLTNIQTVNVGNLPPAAAIVQLTDSSGADKDKLVDLILEGLLEAALSGVASIGLPPAGSVAAALLASGLGTAFSIYEGKNPPNNQGAVTIEYGKLADQLNTLFLNSVADNNTNITTIVTDLGKVTAVSDQITSGKWPLLNQTVTQITDATTNAFNLYFYQSLIPVKWQIVTFRYGDYVKFPVTTVLKVPEGDYFTVPTGYELGMPVEQVYFMNELGGPTDINSTYLGPFPGNNLAMINTVLALPGVSATDFWTGQNGWNLIKQVKAIINK